MTSNRRGYRGLQSQAERDLERLESKLPDPDSKSDVTIDAAMADNYPELETRLGDYLTYGELEEYDI